MEYVTVAGEDVPALGLGTYKLRGQECTRVVSEALELGYRHVDTAEYYDNQAAVGEGIAAADVDREEVFLTTKVWKSNLERDDVLRVGRDAVDKLGVDAVDLLLIHWPSETVPIEETLGAMGELQDEGLVRHVGVSNFSVSELREAMAVADSPILTDQVKYHPYHGQQDLLEFCATEEVMLTAYTPLARGRIMDDETLLEIGERYDKTPAQVALRWLVQQDPVAAIPKASSRDHLAENLAIFDFELTDAEMEAVFDLQGGLLERVRSALGL